MYSQLYSLIGPQLLEVSYYPWLTGSFACYVHRRKALVFSHQYHRDVLRMQMPDNPDIKLLSQT